MSRGPFGNLGCLCLRAGGAVVFSPLDDSGLRFLVPGFGPGFRSRPVLLSLSFVLPRPYQAARFVWVGQFWPRPCGYPAVRAAVPWPIWSLCLRFAVPSSRYCIAARGAGLGYPARLALASVRVPELRRGSRRVPSRIALPVPIRCPFGLPELPFRGPEIGQKFG